MTDAGLLVLNKSTGLPTEARETVTGRLPNRALFWTDHGVMALTQLPGSEAHAGAAVDNFVPPKTLAQMPAVWSDPRVPICLSQGQSEGWSIGWRWHPRQRFDTTKVLGWLKGLNWRRAKLVIHSETGWVSGNALDGDDVIWSGSEWRRDSRLELIFTTPQDESALQAGLATCVLSEDV